uniref:VIP peptides n=1 Tax=Euleptes europaea TaxID=460621 RepID=UPI0025405225|nr:VIP peptides [Euleptes europaea]
MEHRSGSQLLLSFILLCILCSRALALPPLEAYPAKRNTRHADGIFTNDYSRLLSQLSAQRYLESLIGKRVGNSIPFDEEDEEEELPVKRQSDALFTDNYIRHRNQIAAMKYLESIFAGKSKDDLNPTSLQDEIGLLEPAFLKNYDGVTLDDLLNQPPLAS